MGFLEDDDEALSRFSYCIACCCAREEPCLTRHKCGVPLILPNVPSKILIALAKCQRELLSYQSDLRPAVTGRRVDSVADNRPK